MDLLDVALVLGGLALVGYVFADAFDTLLATNIRGLRPSLTSAYYRTSWRLCRAVAVRMEPSVRRERLLALFGPASFLGLLLLWTSGTIVAWGLVWWGLRSQFTSGPEDLGASLYYSGVVYFSIGFGDILPGSTLTRLLSMMEALAGLGTLGLVIGYLPTLSAAYAARERQLLLLDDLGDARITPFSLLVSEVGPDGDLERVEALFRDWEVWCAEVYESHTSLPMLVLWRSKHRGHSWVTALGVVTDAAMGYMALVPGAERGPAMRLYRQSLRLLTDLAEQVQVEAKAESALVGRLWSVAYSSAASFKVELRSYEESLALVRGYRAEFSPLMEGFIDELLAPRGFWGITAADHLAEADLGSILDDD